ncbi:hypothetical protein ACQQ2N_03895 [Dokdonella sp. MW10]|uniref:hypothetical protein n=1 Tax=Dokdonella sp. MW10 TaxID=2992926 RepID=UPI003F81D29A
MNAQHFVGRRGKNSCMGVAVARRAGTTLSRDTNAPEAKQAEQRERRLHALASVADERLHTAMTDEGAPSRCVAEGTLPDMHEVSFPISRDHARPRTRPRASRLSSHLSANAHAREARATRRLARRHPAMPGATSRRVRRDDHASAGAPAPGQLSRNGYGVVADVATHTPESSLSH